MGRGRASYTRPLIVSGASCCSFWRQSLSTARADTTRQTHKGVGVLAFDDGLLPWRSEVSKYEG